MICEICKKEFKIKTKNNSNRFCSRECYWKWLSIYKREENSHRYKGCFVCQRCETCGRTFWTKNYLIKKGAGKYCSSHCRSYGMPKPDIKTRVQLVCPICKKVFFSNTYKIKNGEGKTCSRKCHGIFRSTYFIGDKAANWQNKVFSKKCEICNSEIRTTEARVKDNRGRFCSKECFHKWHGIYFRGSNHPNWFDGPKEYPEGWNESHKEIIRERDGRICQICKVPENGHKHHVHHIDYIKENIDESNLITLCHSCHTKTGFNREQWKTYFKESA
jgi:hypothetical protein